ncbi:MAG: ABC transporter ATP-binding protein [Spirochaetes bacterium]|nr:ABC transporter ATP-binding protein [Spirochaetota bacterium]
MSKIVETKKLIKDYQIKKITVNALRGIDMTINESEFTAIVGPSGSGKSTLLHLIGCLDTPTSGEVLFDNTSVGNMKKDELAYLRREKMGFIFQAYNLIPVLTAFENVAFPLTLLGYNSEEIKEKSYESLKVVGLESMEKRRPTEMSGGQQQRVAIARALIKAPKLILADEPTANLDSITATEVLEIMKKLNQDKKVTFLFSTHDKLVMDFANRIIKLRDGKIQEDVKK